MEHMPPKGRLQDVGSPQATRIIELDKKAIPLLIACLTDETPTKKSIEDYWPVTTVGDIAFFFLCDLFTDSSWQRTTIDGVVDWHTLQTEFPGPAPNAWYSFVEKHGRKYVQNVWYKRWKQVEADVVWDQKEQCFKVGLATGWFQDDCTGATFAIAAPAPDSVVLRLQTGNANTWLFAFGAGWVPVKGKLCTGENNCEDAAKAELWLDESNDKENTTRVFGRYKLEVPGRELAGEFVLKYKTHKENPFICE
jgi:hypothetical protein